MKSAAWGYILAPTITITKCENNFIAAVGLISASVDQGFSVTCHQLIWAPAAWSRSDHGSKSARFGTDAKDLAGSWLIDW